MNRRRPRAKTEADRRRHSVVVRMSDAEVSAVDAAREGTEWSRARWLWMAAEAELGWGPGPGEESERGALVREVLAARIALDRIGRNLNQAVAAMNSTGEVQAAQLEAILDRVDRAVGQVHEATMAVTDRRRRL